MAKRLILSLNRILAEKTVPPSKTTAGILLPEKTAKVVSVAANNHYKRISHELLHTRAARDSNNDEVNTSDTEIVELEKSNIPLMNPTGSEFAQSVPFGEKDLASDESLWNLYERWRAHYPRSRDLGETSKRFNVFKKNAKLVHEFNKKDVPCKLELNELADVLDEEFESTYGGFMSDYDGFESNDSMYENANSLPASVDWRAQGVVNAVKDQGQCR